MSKLLALVVVFIAVAGGGEVLVGGLAPGPFADAARFVWDAVATWLVVGVFCGAFPLLLSGRVTFGLVIVMYGIVFAFAAFALAVTLADTTLSGADLAAGEVPDELARAAGEFVSMGLLFAGVLGGIHLKARFAPRAALLDRHLLHVDHVDS